ncbi:MAG: hypothetical protein BGO41_01290 [Clostridiales bacterium 38-18]|nr:MAG: hypothetical protein BGO41_01290 [Clostridiales bacterium 38-18]
MRNSTLKSLIETYPGIITKAMWETPEGKIWINKMTKKHIENTVNMLKDKSSFSLTFLEKKAEARLRLYGEDDQFYKNYMEAIMLIRDKIEDFEKHLDEGDYEKFY